MASEAATVRELLAFTLDGEWGLDPKDSHPYGTTEMRIIRGTDFDSVEAGSINSVPVRSVRSDIAIRKALKPGDVLIETAGGSAKRSTGRVCLVSESILKDADRPVTCASFARFLRFNKAKINPEFAYWSLQNLYANGTMAEHQVQHTGIARFQFTKFAEAQTLLIPSTDDQTATVELLRTIQDRILSLTVQCGALESIARAVFKSWFVDFDPVRAKAEGREPDGMDAVTSTLFPCKLEESARGTVPTGWSIKPLSEFVDINPLRSLSKAVPSPYLEMANAPTNGPRPTAWVDRLPISGCRFRNGDTLLAKITPCLENGKTAFVDFLEEKQVGWGSTEFVVLAPKGPIPSVFGYLLARDSDFRAFAIQSMSGTSGRQRIQVDQLAKFEFATADAAVYGAFAEIVEPMFAAISHNDNQANTLAELLDTLLPRLISGKLRVPEAEEMLEAVL